MLYVNDDVNCSVSLPSCLMFELCMQVFKSCTLLIVKCCKSRFKFVIHMLDISWSVKWRHPQPQLGMSEQIEQQWRHSLTHFSLLSFVRCYRHTCPHKPTQSCSYLRCSGIFSGCMKKYSIILSNTRYWFHY